MRLVRRIAAKLCCIRQSHRWSSKSYMVGGDVDFADRVCVGGDGRSHPGLGIPRRRIWVALPRPKGQELRWER